MILFLERERKKEKKFTDEKKEATSANGIRKITNACFEYHIMLDILYFESPRQQTNDVTKNEIRDERRQSEHYWEVIARSERAVKKRTSEGLMMKKKYEKRFSKSDTLSSEVETEKTLHVLSVEGTRLKCKVTNIFPRFSLLLAQ
ncbi:CLUMA_CG010872, isoform A [Clunio marinus]|uniref:CLUMA_CG010872, isoform A n=1 Tax=Clunio marinus TaxID=568069 RepID=A0A1J1IB93_9DIPT|nr:CLUMA_CG010872, isoform A [Clunio marinus]